MINAFGSRGKPRTRYRSNEVFEMREVRFVYGPIPININRAPLKFLHFTLHSTRFATVAQRVLSAVSSATSRLFSC